jgi:hypothetical protein
MSRRLNGRVQALERQADQVAGCAACGGVMIIGLGDGEPWPTWLDDESCCRRCGSGVKVVPQRYLAQLA